MRRQHNGARTRIALIGVMAAATMTTAPLAAQSRQPPAPSRRDSAGITIIEYASLGPSPPQRSNRAANPFERPLFSLASAFEIDARPYLDLGGPNRQSQIEFSGGNWMLAVGELSDGTIVVGDLTALKFFTSTGQFLRVTGRKGQGPGEFQRISEICALRGDSLLVRDNADGRLSMWNSHGEHLRTYASAGNIVAGSCDRRGFLVGHAGLAFDRIGSTPTDRLAEHWIVRPDGTRWRALGALPAPVLAGTIARMPSVVSFADDVWVANARMYELRLQRSDGHVILITRFTRQVKPFSDGEWQEMIEFTVPRGTTARNRANVQSMMGPKPPGYYPAYSTIRVDPMGRVWIPDFEDFSAWTVLDASGELRGRMDLSRLGATPLRRWLVAVARDHFIAQEEDADGFMHLRFYRYR